MFNDEFLGLMLFGSWAVGRLERMVMLMHWSSSKAWW